MQSRVCPPRVRAHRPRRLLEEADLGEVAKKPRVDEADALGIDATGVTDLHNMDEGLEGETMDLMEDHLHGDFDDDGNEFLNALEEG